MKPLDLKGVSVALDGSRVVEDFSLSVEAGEWVGLIGPNGAGKTTVLRAIAGLVPYTGGIAVRGDEVAALSRREVARRIALVPQSPVLPPDMSMLEYVLLGRTPHLGYAAALGARDVDSCRLALGRLDAAHLADRRLGSLSGGEWQRAVLARAMAQDAGLILLDEPTTALDVTVQAQILDLIQRLQSELDTAIVMITHDLGVVAEVTNEPVARIRGTRRRLKPRRLPARPFACQPVSAASPALVEPRVGGRREL